MGPVEAPPTTPTPEELGLEPPPPPEVRRRRRIGVAVIAVGIALIVWSALFLSHSAQGGRVRREFKDRVSYNQSKTNIHAAFPTAVALGLGGLAVCLLGAKIRRGPRSAESTGR